MLVLTRKPQERIQIGDSITITVVRVQGNSVRIGIEAPQEVAIRRGELVEFEADELSDDSIDSITAKLGANKDDRSGSDSMTLRLPQPPALAPRPR